MRLCPWMKFRQCQIQFLFLQNFTLQFFFVLLSALLLIPLSLTYSRTGFAVAGLEVVVWAVLSGRRRAAVAFLALGAAVAVVSGAVMRFAPDAAAMNRLSIWWAGLKLSAIGCI